MSETFNTRAELEVRLEGIREMLNDLENAKDGVAELDDIQAKWTKRLGETKREIAGADRELKKLSGTAKTAKNDLAPDAGAKTEWDNLSDKIKRAELDYKAVARAAIAAGQAAPSASGFLGQRGISTADVARFQAGNRVNLVDSLGLNGEDLSGLPRLRYALYDVASTANITAAAISGVGVASAMAFSSMESSFTNVERTLDNVSTGQVQQLRDELVGLTREIPLAFADVSQIATLGNQLGIASGDIAQFTETTAKFSAVTGLTAEASAQAFGSLGELLNVQAADYERLGSSIALVGRRSVATEAEIVAMTQRLAASATNAGFTSQQVVALSGALASLRVAPERAQGVMEVYFNRLNTAIAEGGERLNAFAAVAGVSAGEVEALVRTNPVEFFERLATGLGSMDQIAQTGALEALGLQGIRAGEVFGRVSANVDVFNAALQDANQGWIEGTELGKQYALVVDDLASRWQIFLNAVQEAGAAVGAVLAPFIEHALAVVTDLLQKFAEFAETPIGGWVVGVGAAISALIAILAGLTGAAALASASFLAIRTALGEVRLQMGLTAGAAGGLSGSMLGVASSTGIATTALGLFRAALMATGIGALLVLTIGLLADFDGTMLGVINTVEWLNETFIKFISPARGLFGVIFGLANALGIFGGDLDSFVAHFNAAIDAVAAGPDIVAREFGNFMSDIGAVFGGIAGVFDAIGRVFLAGAGSIGQAVQSVIGPAIQPILDFLNDVGRAISQFFSQFGAGFNAGVGLFDRATTARFDQARNAFGGLTSAQNAAREAIRRGASVVRGYNNEMANLGGGPSGGGGNAGGAAKAIRTLVDYANDLSGVMSRAFDLRFGNQQGLDSITSGWRKIAEASASAREEIAKYQATLAGIAADRSIKEYWLSVAEMYGDQLRATKLRAELAELDDKQADAQKGLTKAQAKTNKTLTGNTDAAIENRETILGMVDGYQDLLKTYAANGMSQQDLQRKAAQLKREFIAQATQLGFSRAEVQRYAASFDDMGVAIARVPRNITVSANPNPALQALNEFAAKARSVGATAGRNFASGFGGTGTISPRYNLSGGNKLARQQALLAEVVEAVARAAAAARNNNIRDMSYWRIRAAVLNARMQSGNYWSGGYVGDGGKYEPMGTVHGGEFVFSKAAVRTAGVNNLNFMHQMLKAGKIPAIGGAAGASVVDISAASARLIAGLLAANLQVVLPGAQLAGSIGAHNVATTSRGGA